MCSTGGIRRSIAVCARAVCDDFLRLPHVTSRHAQVTGDRSALDDTHELGRRPYARCGRGVVLRSAGALAAAGNPVPPLRAGDRTRGLKLRGERGLPLIGTGDWNDGMNRVGAGGKGESVWLAFFPCTMY